MKWCRAIMLALLVPSVVNAYEYMSGEDYERKTHNPIPLKRNEKVLTNKGYQAQTVIFIFARPYADLLQAARTATAQLWGSVTYFDRTASEYSGAGFQTSPELKEIMMQDLAQMRKLNINVESFKLAEASTDAYNKLDDKTFSKLLIRIADGKDIFGKVCSLVLIRRTDHYMDWYREFHTDIPVLPLKGAAKADLVTTSELELVTRMEQALGVPPVAHVFSSIPESVIGSRQTYEQIKQKLNDVLRN